MRTLVTSLALCAAAFALQPSWAEEPPPTQAPPPAEDDGWFDLSDFLDEKYGFLPLLVPITEPAVGYGAAGGLAFIDKPRGCGPEPSTAPAPAMRSRAYTRVPRRPQRPRPAPGGGPS